MRQRFRYGTESVGHQSNFTEGHSPSISRTCILHGAVHTPRISRRKFDVASTRSIGTLAAG